MRRKFAPATPEIYAEFVEAFRKAEGPYFSQVATIIGCSWFRAKQAWDDGWVRQPLSDFGPIREYFEREKADAPGAASAPGAAAEVRHSALRHPVPDVPRQVAPTAPEPLRTESQAKEARALDGARNNSLGLISTMNRLIKILYDKGGPVMEGMINELARDDHPLSAQRFMAMLETVGNINGKITAGLKTLMEAQRLLDGAPQSISKTVGVLSDEDRQDSAAATAKLVGALRRRIESELRGPVIDVLSTPVASIDAPAQEPIERGNVAANDPGEADNTS